MKTAYENRVTFFIDILGFKNIIKETIDINGNDIPEKIQNLIDTLTLIKSHLNNDLQEKSKLQSRQITQFSDSIIISFKEDQDGEVFNTLYDIQKLLIILVEKNIICRGAISYGKLIHNDNYIFGPALNKAYETESKAALYPRIILDKTIIEIGMKYHYIDNTAIEEKSAIKNLLLKDTDEMYYIDYFLNPEPALPDFKKDLGPYIKTLREIIVNGIKNSSEYPDIKIKYNWMRNKFNSLVKKWKEPLGQIFLNHNTSLLNFIQELEFIKD
jgi:hypothetical protein